MSDNANFKREIDNYRDNGRELESVISFLFVLAFFERLATSSYITCVVGGGATLEIATNKQVQLQAAACCN